MAQFLRFAALIILTLIGFGTGICGLLGIGFTVFDSLSPRGGRDDMAGVAIVISVVSIVVAIGCFFAIRALARSLRAHTTPITPPAPPPAPPPPPV
jgi:hypothetical protein